MLGLKWGSVPDAQPGGMDGRKDNWSSVLLSTDNDRGLLELGQVCIKGIIRPSLSAQLEWNPKLTL